MAELFSIPVDKIHPHPDNPRKDLGDLEELSASIKANGIFQNLTVVPDGDEYTVIIGHRRLAAAKKAGLLTVPCVIRNMTTQEQVRTMLMENMQRSDLTVYEQAEGFQMMLDLGDSVATIAESTGFSESTVRRRVKLCALDKAKFKKAAERGATLFDLAELEAIEDPELRNEVLGYCGTSNFKNKLEKAKQDERLKKRMAEWIAAIDPFAYKISKRDEFHGNAVPMQHYYGYGYFNLESDVIVPDDAADVRYFYIVESDRITIFKEKQNSSSEAAEMELKNRYKAWIDELESRFSVINDRHYQLRMDFVSSFSGAQKNTEVLERMTIDLLTRERRFYGDKDLHWNTLCSLLGIEDDDKTAKELTENEKFKEQLSFNYSYLLLAVLYSCIEDEKRNRYFDTTWSGENQRYIIKHVARGNINEVYAFLTALGYEMSDEEIQMADGTHPLFQEKFDDEG
jgi:ParB family chromosome partitioning protein